MTGFAVAEAGIRQLQARYADAVWRKDARAFGDCMTEDCQWRIGGHVANGRTEIVDYIGKVFPRFQRIFLTFQSPVVDVGDGMATGRTYVTEQSVFTDGQPFFMIGTYYERFVDQGDRWRFAWRLFQFQYVGPADLSGSFIDNKDFGPPPAMPDIDEPPSALPRLRAAKPG
jgi:hypothetical protein